MILHNARLRILKPIPVGDWREPSAAQPKNCFGHQNQARFRFRAFDRAGRVQWVHWLDDRAEADDLLWHIAHGWRPDVDGFARIDFATVFFVVSGTSWSVPSDCIGVSGQSGEFIDCVGAGGSGANNRGGNIFISGGGGGAWSRSTSGIVLTPSGSVPVAIGAGGAAIVRSTTANGPGNAGGDTSFNSGEVLAKGGGGGVNASGTPTNGGAAASGVGQSKFSGGNGGGGSTGTGSSGGGGAAGPNGNGLNGANSSGTNGSAGGGADNGTDGAGSAAGTTSSPAGGNGTRYDATHGLGGGSGSTQNSNTTTAGAGGAYGGGSGGSNLWTAVGTSTTSKAGEGFIVVSYVPGALAAGGNKAFNMPMMGM